MNSLLYTWASVRPRAWNALAGAELQSLRDLQRLMDAAAGRVAPLPTRSRLHPEWPSELFRAAVAESQSDEFFRDLPGWEQLAKEANEPEKEAKAPAKEQNKDKEPDKKAAHFSAYSFSHSSVVGADGKRVASTRRRYEDSSGRLKAEHEREVGGVKHRAVWDRPNAEDEAQGKHETSVTGSSADEFERLWAQTPFAKAEAGQEEAKQLKAEPETETKA